MAKRDQLTSAIKDRLLDTPQEPSVLERIRARKDELAQEVEEVNPAPEAPEIEVIETNMDEEDVHEAVQSMINERAFMQQMTEAEEQGFYSYISGLTEVDNPYADEDENMSDAWLEGYDAAQERAEMVKVVVSAKFLQKAQTAEEIDNAFEALMEAVDGIQHMEAIAEFWEVLMEGMSDES